MRNRRRPGVAPGVRLPLCRCQETADVAEDQVHADYEVGGFDDGGARAIDGARTARRRGVLRLSLTEPETVPITDEQHKEAVRALAVMISDWLRRQPVPPGSPRPAADPGEPVNPG
jgi:hypothetical protein